MLARELSWYRGNFLAETLYTCIYLHDMDRLGSNSILKAFCELTRLTCLKVLSLVHRAGVSEVMCAFSFFFLSLFPLFISFYPFVFSSLPLPFWRPRVLTFHPKYNEWHDMIRRKIFASLTMVCPCMQTRAGQITPKPGWISRLSWSKSFWKSRHRLQGRSAWIPKTSQSVGNCLNKISKR